MAVSTDERNALCDLFTEVGPDAPTLCEGWQTRDLAAHLVVREHRPDTLLGVAPGMAFKRFAAYTKRVQDGYARRPWAELVGQVRGGPPVYWPTRIAAFDKLVNSIEFFVHHEDVRRARPGWEPRPPDAERDAVLWTGLGRATWLLLRHSPVGLVLRRPDGQEIAAKRGPNTVTLLGEPGELVMWAFGRDANRVAFEGEQSSVAAARGLTRGM